MEINIYRLGIKRKWGHGCSSVVKLNLLNIHKVPGFDPQHHKLGGKKKKGGGGRRGSKGIN